VHYRLRRITRVFDLVGAGDQQGMELWRDAFGAREEHVDRRGQAQVPAQRTERNSTHGRAMFDGLKRRERDIR
jgi:hypothetical protein